MEKVTEGYGEDFLTVAYTSPDFEMLQHLQQNVYSFSAAKNWQQLQDMTRALTVDERLRTQGEYIEQVEAMNLRYNRDWLITERNTAIAGGQMASRWVDFEEHAEDMPMLQYKTVGDGNVRIEHQALDGIIRPIEDDFWNSYYPPNGWNCRCDVIQLPNPNVEPTRDVLPLAGVSPLFETNLAKQGLIFPKGHPYFEGIPKAELRRAMAYLPPQNSYYAVRGVKGEVIEVHLLHEEREVVRDLALSENLQRLGYKEIKILPALHEREVALKARFLPKDYKPINPKKNPDAWIKTKEGRNLVADYKIMTGERNFARRLSEAAEQAEFVVVQLDFTPKKLGKESMKRTIADKIALHKNLKGVLILDQEGKLYYEAFRD